MYHPERRRSKTEPGRSSGVIGTGVGGGTYSSLGGSGGGGGGSYSAGGPVVCPPKGSPGGGSGKNKRYPVSKGVNAQGNEWTSYNDGTFRYTNKDGGVKTRSTYYHTSNGHSFFKETKHGAETSPYKYDNNRTPTKYHENHNTGVRRYQQDLSKHGLSKNQVVRELHFK